jgi:hypothetical protein
MSKKANGQFFTTTNPFSHNLFLEWFGNIPKKHTTKILEPFAGCGNIIKMIKDIGFKNDWHCFDLQPPTDNNHIQKRDTIKHYPKGFHVAITNPPYLARNSATRSGLAFPTTKYDDLYKVCLEIMLNNNKYVAAIIPESFITSSLFQDRLYGVISLTYKMFDDTDCPVCLALFNNKKQKDFIVYSDDKKIGYYNKMKKNLLKSTIKLDLSFNSPTGQIGLYGVDNTKTDSIRFVLGSNINPDIIKPTSRAITRIKVNNNDINYQKFINQANNNLEKFRQTTHDIFLTSFKGLREDNKYRRRLDYKSARNILNITYKEMYM